MTDDYITVTELVGLLGLFVGPFILVAAVAQFLILRRARVRSRIAGVLVTVAAILTIPLTFVLLWMVPTVQPLAFRFGILARI
jgi:hypothetical protein